METWVPPLGQNNTLEEEMAIHSNILAWRISGRPQSIKTEQLTPRPAPQETMHWG